MEAAGTEPVAVHLSARQRDVLSLVGFGYTDREIAERLGIAPRTVRMHCDVLKAKFAVTKRRELLRFRDMNDPPRESRERPHSVSN
jgi:DNA-binding CsgD family transcriptional regulator